MISDSFFEQGFQHNINEDYALHGKGYVIVSDGCSNGGGPSINSDWGSRILCKAGEENIKEKDPESFLKCVRTTAMTQRRIFPNLEENCLTATFMCLREHNKQVQAIIVGDGIVGSIKDDVWVVKIIEFIAGGESNLPAPFYLKYQMCSQVDDYLKTFGGKYKITTYCGDLMNSNFDIVHNKDRKRFYEQNMDVYEEMRDISLNTWEEFLFQDMDCVFICSDGLQSFYQPVKTATQKYNESIFTMDALRVLLNFPQFKAGCANTQRNWAFRQDKTGTFKRRNWLTGDDVSVGVLCKE